MKLFARLSILIVLFATFFVSPVLATENRQDVHIIVEKNEVINKDYFAAGDSVRMSGTVNGDVYVAGGAVIVDGIINGDLFVAGGTVQVAGPVKNDIRAVGGTISLTDAVGGNVTLGAGTVIISPEAHIKGSVLAASGDLGIYGPVGRGITAGAGTLTINTSVGGDMMVAVGELLLQPKTSLSGDLTYWSEKEAVVKNNVKISGDFVYHKMEKTEAKQAQIAKGGAKAMMAAFTGMAITMTMVELLAMFVGGLIVIALLPSFTQRTVKGMQKNLWGSFGLGMVTSIMIPIVGVILMMTVIGIPEGIFIFMALILLSVIGNIYAALYIGHAVVQKLNTDVHQAWQLLVGLIIMGIFTVIPVFGWLARCVFGLIGIGAVLFEKQATYKQMRLKHII